MKRSFTRLKLVIPAIGALLPTTASAGPGDLLVSPVRIVAEGRNRVAEVTLVNKGDKAATYRLSIQNKRMLENGSFETIEKAGEGELFADKLIRYAPRSIKLSPGAPQTIRVMIRKPAELADGEYRSHLQFAAVPDSSDTNSIETNGSNVPGGISIKLTPIYGVTIPVIVRHGELNAAVTLSKARIQYSDRGMPEIVCTLTRSGEKSVYGDFVISGGKNGSEAIGNLRGIALYAPNSERIVAIPLPPDFRTRSMDGPINVTFKDRSDNAIHAQVTIPAL